VTVEEPFRCTCDRFEAACTTRMTQEDLLCDMCREGCNVAIGFGDGEPAFHGKVAPWPSISISAIRP
jgi:hypothetical protein